MFSQQGSEMPCTAGQELKSAWETACCSIYGTIEEGQAYQRRLVEPCLQISFPAWPDMALLVFVPLVHLGYLMVLWQATMRRSAPLC